MFALISYSDLVLHLRFPKSIFYQAAGVESIVLFSPYPVQICFSDRLVYVRIAELL